MFDKHYKKGKTHKENARKQKFDGRLTEAIDAYQNAIKKFKAQGFSFHDVKRHLVEAYLECGAVYKCLGDIDKADYCYKEARKYGLKYYDVLVKQKISKNVSQPENIPIKIHSIGSSVSSISLIETTTPTFLSKPEFFTQDPSVASELHSKMEDINEIHNTRDLAYCLQPNHHTQEQASQLIKLTLEVIDLFAHRKAKTIEMIHEIIVLASIPNKRIYEELLEQSIQAVNNTTLQHADCFFCLTEVIQNMPNSLLTSGEVSTGNLVAILNILHLRLEDLHKQDKAQLCELLQAICSLLDVMMRVGVKNVSREKLHEPLYNKLQELKDTPALAYHANYAYQALLHIPNDEKLWQEVVHRTFKVLDGTANLVNVFRKFEPNKLLDAFKSFCEAFEGAGEVIGCIRELVETDQELQEGIENIFQGIEFRRTRQWYLALKFIDVLLQENQLVSFEQFVRQSPYNKNRWFLIGLCQRLGKIACTQQDLKIQQGAIEFLVDLYQNETQWGKHLDVKKWVLKILRQLANHENDDLKNCAKVMLGKLAPREDTHSSDTYVPLIMYSTSQVNNNSELLAKARLNLSLTESLISNTTKPLTQLKEGILNELEQDAEIKNALDLYVSPKGKWFLNSTNSFDLENEVDNFLKSEKKVLLLLGEAGAGKSTFNRHLVRRLWADCSLKDRLDNNLIPLFISLPTIENPNENLIQNYFLKKMKFSDEIIENLRQNCKFVFILDGYDEIKDRRSIFYDRNELHEWDAQVIISCRPEYLSTNYQQKFIPNHNSRLFQEILIAPFSIKEIREYIGKYVEKPKENIQVMPWDVQRYEATLKLIPNSDNLLSNPFILTIAMQVIPDLLDRHENENFAKNITRLTLYNKFVEKWFERSQDRLRRIQLDDEEEKAFKELDETDFMRSCMRFNEELATEMFKVNEIVVEYLDADEKNWRAKFFGYNDPKTRLLRYNSPLSRNEDQYRFIHKSLFEYFVARTIFEAICKEARSVLFEETSILRDSGVVRFLTEYVQQRAGSSKYIQQIKIFKETLFNFIEKSKKDTNFETAAANAITILNKAGMNFSGKNLNAIHIAGADLSYGVFDYAKLKGADLSNVNFKGAWLRYADFSGANMTGVQFGEFPILNLGYDCCCCCYSPDGGIVAIASGKKLYLYNVKTLEMIHTFEGHTDTVSSVTISPDGNQLASGSDDRTVRLWSIENLDPNPRILEGHSNGVKSVTFSPDGTKLASGSSDNTVRLWSIENLDPNPRILEGHASAVWSVVFSHDGTQLASSSLDKTVRVWSIKNLDQNPRILGHNKCVSSVAFSPDSTQLASGSDDNTVQLWSLENLDPNPRILKGHTDNVYSVSFSPNGTQLASSSLDKTVRLWSIENLDLDPHILEGHNSGVNSVAFSPDGTQLASSSNDNTVRLWSLENSDLNPRILEGHVWGVKTVAFSPDGTQLASGSYREVRLWSIENLDSNPRILERHTSCVNSVTFSPDSTQLASGSDDNTVRLWSLENLDPNPRIIEHDNGAKVVTSSFDDTHLESSSYDKAVQPWSIENLDINSRILRHNNCVSSVTFSPDGTQLASGSGDNTVRVWSLENLDLSPRILKGHTDYVYSVTFSPDGTQLASGSYDSTVRLWSLENFDQNPLILEGHRWGVNSVTFSPDGTQLASGGYRELWLWSIENLDLNPRIIEGHTHYVNSVTFSPDGSQLASSSNDNTVRLWSTVSGNCVAILYLPGIVCSLDWKNTKVGDLLLTGGSDNAIRLWHVKRIDDQTSQVALHWTSCQNILWISKAYIQNVKGLDSMKIRFLKQRGATEDSSSLSRNYQQSYINLL